MVDIVGLPDVYIATPLLVALFDMNDDSRMMTVL
jgi:hypothetical protein